MPENAAVINQEQREASAVQAGRAWCVDVRLTLREAGRPAAGGWPGTMTEARALDCIGEADLIDYANGLSQLVVAAGADAQARFFDYRFLAART